MRKAHTISTLKAEIVRIRNRNDWLAEKLAEAEQRLGIPSAVVTLEFEKKQVRLFMLDGEPVVLAADVISLLPNAPKPYGRREQRFTLALQRLRRMKLGDREAKTLRRTDLAESLSLTDRSLSVAFGVSTRAHFIGVVTPLGIESLSDRAPEFCNWVTHVAFPAVIERFSKGGAA